MDWHAVVQDSAPGHHLAVRQLGKQNQQSHRLHDIAVSKNQDSRPTGELCKAAQHVAYAVEKIGETLRTSTVTVVWIVPLPVPLKEWPALAFRQTVRGRWIHISELLDRPRLHGNAAKTRDGGRCSVRCPEVRRVHDFG